MNCVSKCDVHSQVAASLIVGLTAENRKLHLAARLREASATPDLEATEIEQIFGFPDRETDHGGGEVVIIRLVTQLRLTHKKDTQTQIGASGCHHSVPSHGCATAALSQKHKLLLPLRFNCLSSPVASLLA